MYHTPVKSTKAKKLHQCTNCCQTIAIGETYKNWTSFDNGIGFTSKMHSECHKALSADGDFEYMPYCGERPGIEG